MVESLASLPVQSIAGLQQSTAAFAQVTRVATELSASAKTMAAASIRAMSAFLQQHTQTEGATADVEDSGRCSETLKLNHVNNNNALMQDHGC